MLSSIIPNFPSLNASMNLYDVWYFHLFNACCLFLKLQFIALWYLVSNIVWLCWQSISPFISQRTSYIHIRTLNITQVMLWTGSNLIWVSLGMSVWNQWVNKSPSGGWTWRASKASIISPSTSEQRIRIRVHKLLELLCS